MSTPSFTPTLSPTFIPTQTLAPSPIPPKLCGGECGCGLCPNFFITWIVIGVFLVFLTLVLIVLLYKRKSNSQMNQDDTVGVEQVDKKVDVEP
jgi:multisubunit Na+/H+ antiporter MnhC subunit